MGMGWISEHTSSMTENRSANNHLKLHFWTKIKENCNDHNRGDDDHDNHNNKEDAQDDLDDLIDLYVEVGECNEQGAGRVMWNFDSMQSPNLSSMFWNFPIASLLISCKFAENRVYPHLDLLSTTDAYE